MRFFVIILLTAFWLSSSSQDLKFRVLVRGELPAFTGMISSIYRDSRGYLWVSSAQALYRYDGAHYKAFCHNDSDSLSLSHTDIESIFEDNKHQLWFCSKYGLNLYDSVYNRFKQILPYKTTKGGNNRIKDICQLNDSIYFIATYGGGVCRYNSKANTFRHYVHTSSAQSLPSDIINTVYVDKKKRLWVGSEAGGLSLLDPETGICVNYLRNENQSTALLDNTISSIIEDDYGFFWIGTWRGGLHRFDPQTGCFTRFPDLAPSRTVRSIVKGEGDILWLATYKGIVRFNVKTHENKLFLNNPLDPQSIRYDVVWSLCFDREKILWVGTMGRGLCFANTDKQFFSTPDSWAVQYRETYVNDILLKENELWLGTENAGVLVWNLKSKKLAEFTHNSKLNGSITYLLYADSRNNILFGTNVGVYRLRGNSFDFQQQTQGYSINSIVETPDKSYFFGGWNTGLLWCANDSFQNIETYKSSGSYGIQGDIIWRIFLDKQNRLWLLTSGGVGLWNRDRKQFTQLLSDPNVFAISQDSSGAIWCGTSVGTVYQFSEKEQHFSLFHKFTEEPYRIASIVSEHTHLWIATQNGIIYLDKKTKAHRIFTIDDGLPSNFFTWCNMPLPNRYNIAGTANGPVLFKPQMPTAGSFVPNLCITNVEVLGKEVPVKDNTITLEYSQNKVSISFAALSLASRGTITYSYQMQGFDKDLVITTDRKAYYTNLSPGNYRFVVRYKTADGVSSDKEVFLNILVLSPWWSSWWFKILLSILTICVVLILFYLRTRNIRRRNIQLEYEIKKHTHSLEQANELLNEQNNLLNSRAAELENLNNTKNKLFSIIGHDLKNPLSVIMQLSETLNVKYESIDNKKVKQYISSIQSSSLNAYHLLVNLLDWARSQQNSVYIHSVPTQLKPLIDEACNFYSEQIASKGIQLSQVIRDNTNVLSDVNLLKTCVRNLLSNAIKYSHQGGNITFLAEKTNANTIRLSIIDQGIGIEPQGLEQLFEINKQPQYGTANEKGTGLGLLIVKEFVALMNGSIAVESTPNKGSCFTIELPTTTLLADASNYETASTGLEPALQPDIVSNRELSLACSNFLKNKKILVIDDDLHLRQSIKALLDEFCMVILAENAMQGHDLIIDQQPDLILCDVEMPLKTGFELCREVKQNIAISHIPFILLTALNAASDTITGLHSGADDYITKPFNRDVLLLKIHHLFKLRHDLRFLFKLDDSTQIDEGKISSVDERLLKKIIAEIERNLSNPEFSVEQLSEAIGIHRSHLSRKMNAMVNMGTNEFIRMIRLKKAAELLKTGKLSIAEAAYDTGFNDSKYFSKCFKEFFGKSPSTFLDDTERK